MLRQRLMGCHAVNPIPNPRVQAGPGPWEPMSDGLSECLSAPSLLVLGSLCSGKSSTGRRLALGGTRRARHATLVEAGRQTDEDMWLPSSAASAPRFGVWELPDPKALRAQLEDPGTHERLTGCFRRIAGDVPLDGYPEDASPAIWSLFADDDCGRARAVGLLAALILKRGPPPAYLVLDEMTELLALPGGPALLRALVAEAGLRRVRLVLLAQPAEEALLDTEGWALFGESSLVLLLQHDRDLETSDAAFRLSPQERWWLLGARPGEGSLLGEGERRPVRIPAEPASETALDAALPYVVTTDLSDVQVRPVGRRRR